MRLDKQKIVILTVLFAFSGIIGLILLVGNVLDLSTIFMNDVQDSEIQEEEQRKTLGVSKSNAEKPSDISNGINWNKDFKQEISLVNEKNPPFLLIKDSNGILYISQVISKDLVELKHFIDKTASNIYLYDPDTLSYIKIKDNDLTLVLKEMGKEQEIFLDIEGILNVIDTSYSNNSFYLNIETKSGNSLYWLNLEDRKFTKLADLTVFGKNFSFVAISSQDILFRSGHKCYIYYFYNKLIEPSNCINNESEAELKVEDNTYKVINFFISEDRTYFIIRNLDNELELVSQINIDSSIIRTKIQAPFKNIDFFFEYRGAVYVIDKNKFYYFDFANLEWRGIDMKDELISSISLLNEEESN